MRKKKVLELLDPEHSNRVNDFLKEKNYRLTTEEEVKELIEFYNSL